MSNLSDGSGFPLYPVEGVFGRIGLESSFIACLEAEDIHEISQQVISAVQNADLDMLLVYWRAAYIRDCHAAATLCSVWLGVLGDEEIMEDMIDIIEA